MASINLARFRKCAPPLQLGLILITFSGFITASLSVADSCNEVNIIKLQVLPYEFCSRCVSTKRSDVTSLSCQFLVSEVGYTCSRDEGGEGISDVYRTQKDCIDKLHPGPFPPTPVPPTGGGAGFSWAWFVGGILFIAIGATAGFVGWKHYKTRLVAPNYEDI